MKSIGIDPTGKYFTGCRSNGVISSCQSCNRIKQDHNIMSAFHHSLSFRKNKVCYFHVFFSGFVKCRGNYFCIYTSFHISNLFRTFVDQKDHHINFRVIGSNRIGNIFQQHGLTRFRLGNNHRSLSFSDRSK